MRKTLLQVFVIVVLCVGVWLGFRWVLYPCGFDRGAHVYDAMGSKYRPPDWTREDLIDALRANRIQFKTDGDRVFLTECGLKALGTYGW